MTLVSRRAHYDVILLVQQQGENIMACSAEYFLRDVLLSFLVLLYSSETLPRSVLGRHYVMVYYN
jgi:hypothetical protein